MEFVCPQCGTQGRLEGHVAGQPLTCLHCNHTWTPAPGAVPAPVRRAGKGTVARPPAESKAGRDLETWVSGWVVGGAVSLLVGFLLPIVVERRRRANQTIWFWDMLENANGNLTVSIILPALLAIAALIVTGSTRGRARSMTICLMAIGVIVVNLLLVSGVSFGGSRRLDRMIGIRGAANAIIVLAMLSTTVLAAGNHARKVHASHIGPRLMAGIAGCMLALAFFLPIEDGHAIIEVFSLGEAQKEGWPLLILLGLMLGYALLGIFHFGAYRRPAGLCASVSTFVRMLMFGAPVAILATFHLSGQAERFGMVFMLTIKAALMVYGLLSLIGVGLAGWVGHAIRGPTAGLSHDLVRAFGVEPDLKTKLTRLKEALDEGLLTQEEYEAKRKDVIATSDY